MPRQSKPPMTEAEMAIMAGGRAESKIYQGRQQTADVNRALVGEIVAGVAQQMEAAADESRRFPLSDLEAVERTARQYVESCAKTSTLPTVAGAAAAMGRTRTALYKYAETHNGFSEWLTNFSDLCGEAAAQAAIHGATNTIATIFTLKSRFNWRDTISIEAVQQNKNGITDMDAAAVATKYEQLPAD